MDASHIDGYTMMVGRTDGMAKDVVHMWNKWEIENTNKIHRSERTNFKWMVGWMDGWSDGPASKRGKKMKKILFRVYFEGVSKRC